MGADPLNEGGQFWTPILPAKGSILHAGSHTGDITYSSDIALIRQNEMPGFRRLKIARAQLGVMCSETHPLARIEEPVDPHLIADYPFVRNKVF